jgi:predicted dehydrogenase
VWGQSSYCRNSREGEWNYPIDSNANEQTIDWDEWLGNCPRVPFSADKFARWRKYSDYSAGILSDMFPHRLLPMMKALGPEFPKRVTCIGTRSVHTDREVPDTQHIIAEFPSGYTMVVVGSTANEQGISDVIRGHKAAIYIGESSLELKPERPFADEIDPTTINITEPIEDLAAHHKDFFDCIRSGKTPNCDVELAAKAQVVISLAEISCRDNKIMCFDSDKLRTT